MKHEEVMKMLEEMGLPFAYDHFVEGESPGLPFLVFLYPKALESVCIFIGYVKLILL